MPRYAITFLGENLKLRIDDSDVEGFLAIRYESGIDERNAFRKAYNRLVNEEQMAELYPEGIKQADIRMESITQTGFFAGRFGCKPGLIFYTDDDENET